MIGCVQPAVYPPKPKPGDRVAVLSPSAGLPGVFPRPFELGLARLRGEFGLVPVEYPATRRMGASAAERRLTSTRRSPTQPSQRSSPASAAMTR
jgi:hypothetical protein